MNPLINSLYLIDDNCSDDYESTLWSDDEPSKNKLLKNKILKNKLLNLEENQENKENKESKIQKVPKVDDINTILLKNLSEPEINIEMVNNKTGVKFSLLMDINSKSGETFSIDFVINKKTFLKIAKQLK